MALPQSAIDHYQQQQVITVQTATAAQQLWRQMGENFDLSWGGIAEDMFATVVAGQTAAAVNGLGYVPAVLAEQGIDAPAEAAVNAQRFAGGTRDGRPLESLLGGAVYQSKAQMLGGKSTAEALRFGGDWLQGVVMDSVRDADRQAVASGITVRPRVTGWVRMLNPPSCKFCITLAGKWFRWNQGFQSHPHCDCRHIPSNESVAEDLTVDPYAYFNSLSEKEQDRLFNKRDAQAIRDGGDIYRVVNIRSRGLSDDALKSSGARSGWQARRWDTPSKMTIDDIYAASGGSRSKAIDLMSKNGFITGEQVAGGNLKGNVPSEFGDFAAGALGRGGTRKGATAAYRRAVASGVRDPLEPATQTAAERRLHSAFLSLQAVKRGSNPFAANSLRNPLTPEIRQLVQRQYDRELAKLKLASTPDQVRVLARLLGIL